MQNSLINKIFTRTYGKKDKLYVCLSKEDEWYLLMEFPGEKFIWATGDVFGTNLLFFVGSRRNKRGMEASRITFI
jgi:hypothetical protein